MPIEVEVDFLRSVAASPWPADRVSGEVMLTALGFTPTGPNEDQFDAYATYGLSGSLGTAHNFTFTTHEGTFVAIYFFMGSTPHPNDPATRRTYDALCASVSKEFGTRKRVFDDEETPLLWSVGDLDIEVQLFDRRDSQIMVSIEHRKRSQCLEQAARASSRAGYQ